MNTYDPADDVVYVHIDRGRDRGYGFALVGETPDVAMARDRLTRDGSAHQAAVPTDAR